MPTIRIVDTHTGGEPTRVVVEGTPDLGAGSLQERAARFTSQHDWLRTALTHEPRGSDWMVGALLLPPRSADCAAGVIFFNNVGCLGMCGHGLIGVVEALAHLGKLKPGTHRFDTPAGIASAHLHEDRCVTIANVESYRWQSSVRVPVAGDAVVIGDVAYGGNWFFLVEVDQLDPRDIGKLTDRCRAIRSALQRNGVRGEDGAEIDHIELFAELSDRREADCRNFVLCPGGEYDRSPCGTGTSAKLACLAADGHLRPGEVWRQQSIIGSVFSARYTHSPRGILPELTGRAFVTGETTCVFDPADPYRFGILGKE